MRSRSKPGAKRQAERYDTLAAPIVIITGDRDTVVSPRHHAMRLAAAVPGARLEVRPGFGHLLHHTATDRITRLRLRFKLLLARRDLLEVAVDRGS
jgi:pimeloyl-ACP methyl ester carboxylesterase